MTWRGGHAGADWWRGVGAQITEKDEEALKHLVDIKWEHFEGEDTKGFKLFFHFEPNPFFDNDVLVRPPSPPSLFQIPPPQRTIE